MDDTSFVPQGFFSIAEVPVVQRPYGTEHLLTKTTDRFAFTCANIQEGYAGPLREPHSLRRRTLIVLDGALDVMLGSNGTGTTARLEANDGIYMPAGTAPSFRAPTNTKVAIASSGLIALDPKYQGDFQWVPPNNLFSLSDTGRFDRAYNIQKPWGGEDWLTVLHDGHVLKRIWMTPGNRCSYQLHNFKTETNFLVEGAALVLLEDEHGNDQYQEIRPGSGWYVPRQRRHRVFAESAYVAFEVSTPEVDDVIRIQDDTGRGSGRIEQEHRK